MKDKNTLLSVRGKTIGKGADKINMSRALGHRGSFLEGLDSLSNGENHSIFDHQVIPRDANKSYKIVTGSDGFWQMTCHEDNDLVSDISNTSRELALEARRRWEATWNWDNSLEKFKKTLDYLKIISTTFVLLPGLFKSKIP